jgi:hypothetical protein
MADACIEGRDRYKERQQAEADKGEEETELESPAAELKPGERKVISDGTDGPVVEIIRKGTAAAEAHRRVEVPVEAARKTEARTLRSRTHGRIIHMSEYQCSNGKRAPGKVRSRYDGL